jgi:hypothetical protein
MATHLSGVQNEGLSMTTAEKLVDAIEAFVYEKITYERRIVDDPEWATLRRVNETREHLLEVLQEAFRD